MGGLVIGGEKVVDTAAELWHAVEAGRCQRLSAEDTAPDLDLIEPRGVGGSVVEVDVFVALQPAVMFGFVGIEIVENDMDLLLGIGAADAIHEIQELHPAAPLVRARLDQSGGHFQGGKQGGGAMAFIVMREPGEGLAVRQAQPALGARSRAWMCGFSSTDSTMAFSG